MKTLICVFDVKSKETIGIDLDEIIKSRALFQANSGGGKSYLLRKFLEESHSEVQQLIIDPEGEFKTLKEKYDYLLVSREDSADIKLEIRHAGLLARKLMETGASAILDLYELNPFDRIRFVKAFVEALVNLPKNLWHPCIVIIDEIHTFAPENAKGNSESLQAVADLASRGRKRGYALIGATQKLSKFHKDVAAELNTKFTGRCILDIDQKRAAAELGMKDYTQLRNLKNEFYAFGPAISGTPILVKAYEVKTRHEDIGSSKPIHSASQDKINKLKESFKDLPVEAEQELKTIQDYQKKIQEQNIEIRNLKNAAETSSIPKIDPQAFQKAQETGYRKGIAETESFYSKKIAIIKEHYTRLTMNLEKISKLAQDIAHTAIITDALDFNIKREVIPEKKLEPAGIMAYSKVQETAFSKEPTNRLQIDSESSGLAPAEIKVLSAVLQCKNHTGSKKKIAIVSEYAESGGAFRNIKGKLRSLGYIEYHGENLVATQKAVSEFPNYERIPDTPDEMLNHWCAKLAPAEAKVLRTIFNSFEYPISKDDVATQSNYDAKGGSFRNIMGRLRTLGLIEYLPNNMVQPSKELRGIE